MAILIPSINQTKLPELRPAGKAVLDRENRPQVNLSGVAQAAGQLGRAGAMPNVDPSAFVAEARALGAVGQAMGQAGDVLSAVQMKRYQAQNDIDVADADAQLMQHEQSFEAWKMEHPDPRDWEKKWGEISTGAVETVTGNEKLSDDARQAISLRAKTWGARSGIMVARDATKETFARAKSAVQAQYLRAADSGDDQAVKNTIQEGVQKGYFFEHEGVGMEQQYSAQKERKQKQTQRDAREFDINRFTGLMSEDPFQAEEILKQRGEDGRNQYFQHLDEQDLLKMQGDVRRAVKERQVEAVQVMQDQIITGQADDGKIEETGKLVHLGARDIVELQDFRKKVITAQASNEPMDIGLVTDLFKRASNYDDTKSPDVEKNARDWLDIVGQATVATIHGGELGKAIAGNLREVMSTKHPTPSQRPTDAQAADINLLVKNFDVIEPDWKTKPEKQKAALQMEWWRNRTLIEREFKKLRKSNDPAIEQAGGPEKWLQKKLGSATVQAAVDSIFDGPDPVLFEERTFDSMIK